MSRAGNGEEMGGFLQVKKQDTAKIPEYKVRPLLKLCLFCHNLALKIPVCRKLYNFPPHSHPI